MVQLVGLMSIVVIGGQSSHEDFENRSPKALFSKKWESNHTKEYSLLQKIGVPAKKWEFRTANQQIVRALGGVVEVVGLNLARGQIFTASIGSVDLLYPSV